MIRSAALLLLLLPAGAAAQAPALAFDSAADLVQALEAAADDDAVDAIWAGLEETDQIPFRAGEEAVFLYRGDAASIIVAGDHTGWRPLPEMAMTRLSTAPLWFRADTFPAAARIDYKLVVDGDWILDPANPHVQVSGFGPNSALMMPGWRESAAAVRQPGVPRGHLTEPLPFASGALEMTLHYQVYTPVDYDRMEALPVIYVTDGHEYADDEMGSAVIVLDNLIASGDMEPAIAVFVDPHVDGENRRADLYLGNPAFAVFFAEELVPFIDASYRTRPDRDARVILGTSFGGVFSTYLGLMQPEAFGRLAIQSPAYWTSERDPSWPHARLADMLDEAPAGIFTVYLSTGTINDGEEGARLMHQKLLANDHTVTYREVPEGHSWGNWRGLLADVFTSLLPPNSGAAEAP